MTATQTAKPTRKPAAASKRAAARAKIEQAASLPELEAALVDAIAVVAPALPVEAATKATKRPSTKSTTPKEAKSTTPVDAKSTKLPSVSARHLLVLTYVVAHPACKPKAIVEATGASSVSSALNVLVQKGYVERTADRTFTATKLAKQVVK